MNRKTKFLVIAGIILALASFAVFATNSSIVWNPPRFTPASIAPGQSLNATVSFTNRGLSTINGKELSLEIRGNAAGIVSAPSPTFPENIKKGNTVSVNISIHAPSDQTVRVVSGTLVLLKMKSDGKTKEVFGDALPLEITLSPIPLPPNPGEAGKVTVEGVITNQYKIRDDVLRAIVFAYPASEPIRSAFIQYSQADQKMAEDYLALQNDPVEQKRVVRLDAQKRDNGQFCVMYLFGSNIGTLDERLHAIDVSSDARHALDIVFLNTKERSRINVKTDTLLGGTSERIPNDNEMAALCDTNLLD